MVGPKSILIHIWTNRQGRDNSDSGVQEPTEEDEASKGWTDNLIRNFTSVRRGECATGGTDESSVM